MPKRSKKAPLEQKILDKLLETLEQKLKDASLTEFLGGTLGLIAGIRIYGLDPYNIFKMSATGVLAAKGLESDSEVVGTASLAIMGFLGMILFTDVERIRAASDPLIEEYENPDTTEERKREILRELQALLWKYP